MLPCEEASSLKNRAYSRSLEVADSDNRWSGSVCCRSFFIHSGAVPINDVCGDIGCFWIGTKSTQATPVHHTITLNGLVEGRPEAHGENTEGASTYECTRPYCTFAVMGSCWHCQMLRSRGILLPSLIRLLKLIS